MTTNDIEVLLHYYVSDEPHPKKDTELVKNSLKYFYYEGCIVNSVFGKEGSLVTTEKGKALVKILCATPMPVQVWVDAAGKVIET